MRADGMKANMLKCKQTELCLSYIFTDDDDDQIEIKSVIGNFSKSY